MNRSNDVYLEDHKTWINYLQPEGLVVAPYALLESGVIVNRQVSDIQERLLSVYDEEREAILDFPKFTRVVLGWEAEDLVGLHTDTDLTELEVVLPEFNERLVPSYAVPNPDATEDADPSDKWLLLVSETTTGTKLDDATIFEGDRWRASHLARFERLLRETGVHVGILTNGREVRLVYAPRGESSGNISFPVRGLTEVPGRLMLSGLHELLGEQRIFNAPEGERLIDLLRQSRKYQNEVSEKLALQVLEALWELLGGFQSANEFSGGELLREVLERDPSKVYGGLLTTLMRLVFILYAEDRGLISNDRVYVNNYSLTGLFDRLREDDARYHDTMDQRFGAWPQLLALFRLLHDGAAHGAMTLPARHGHLFDPDVYPFLEGRAHPPSPMSSRAGGRQGTREPALSERSESNGISPNHAEVKEEQSREAIDDGEPTLPRVSDRTIFRVLQKLLYLKGERLSYSALDVEEIGSVYEAMIGFDLEVTTGPSVAVKPTGASKGPPSHIVVDLGALLEVDPKKRKKWLKDLSGCDVSSKSLTALKDATSVTEIVEALGKKVSRFTPRVLPAGSLVLQPTEERRRSGSHYTPRLLTEPIVRHTLDPVLRRVVAEARGEPVDVIDLTEEAPIPRPEQILSLKVCDPAMGSGAFLVEACRYLGDALVKSWNTHGERPEIPPDEDDVLFARRLIAQRCLYGVDRNPFAVDLAKLSLWLATLAKDHPFTFLDHALRHGDSLLGLSREQIEAAHWAPERQSGFVRDAMRSAMSIAEERRAAIHRLGDSDEWDEKQRLNEETREATRRVRMVGDAVIATFLREKNKKARETLRAEVEDEVHTFLTSDESDPEGTIAAHSYWLRTGAQPIPAFHWEIEFPEVFAREDPGFDAFVGNPPFAGKNTIAAANRDNYGEWLKEIHEASHGNADLIAHFFRRAFDLLNRGGALGLIATNTIAQGDTRSSGLRWICTHGGMIYRATKRYKWPGTAAVVVSVVHIAKAFEPRPLILDGEPVKRITAYLFHAGGHDDPKPLQENKGKSFVGSYVLGMGFTFDDTNPDATPIAEMHRLIEKDPRNAERIFPYIGGEEVNSSPTHAHHRYVIDFFDRSLEEASQWPDLIEIVREKVKPDRDRQKRKALRERWWQYAEKRPGLNEAIRGLDRVLVTGAGAATYHTIAMLPPNYVYSHKLIVFAEGSFGVFAALQSLIHEEWSRTYGTTRGAADDLTYNPTRVFQPFPFPGPFQELDHIGERYYRYRADLMVSEDQGLTDTYNRFHEPTETDASIAKLRELHEEMDRAVLDAYGWSDIELRYEFLLDYEIEYESSRRRNPYRYRWPDEIRDEVLARLLALNEARALQEITK